MFVKYDFSSGKEGLHVLILGGVHGNEVAGSIAQREIIKKIENSELILKSGKVTFIPVVNEPAFNADARFVDINLNRVVCFHQNPKNNEEKIANLLIKEIDNCDIMLDLHSTHCEGDVEFGFIDYPTEKNQELLSLIPVENALAGWPEIYAKNETIADCCTERYAYLHNKSGITVECGYHKSPKAIEVALESILNVLAYYKIVDLPIMKKRKQNIIKLDSFIIKKSDGKLSRNYKHLSEIKKGEVLAYYDNGEKIVAGFDGYMIIPNHNANIGDEWFYLGYR